MSVAEMKMKAIEGIMNLQEENAVLEVLNHIHDLQTNNDNLAKIVFTKTVEKFDRVLEKLSQ